MPSLHLLVALYVQVHHVSERVRHQPLVSVVLMVSWSPPLSVMSSPWRSVTRLTEMEIVLHAITESHQAENDVPDCCQTHYISTWPPPVWERRGTDGPQMGSFQSIYPDIALITRLT
jgi:hypothetical protein